MFENPRRGRQARNFATNVSKNARSQIVFRTDIFRKLTLGAPVFIRELKQRRFWALQFNRKRYQFWTIYCLYSFRGDLLEKWWAKPQPKHAKSPLTVDLRRSKTSLLQIFSIFKRHARSTSSVGKRISVKWLYHSTEFKPKEIKWWSIIGVLQYMAIILNYRFFFE